MNSKELYDYLPAEAVDGLKRTEEQIRTLMERINTIGVEQFARVLSSEELSQDDIMGISKELEHNPDPLLYFTIESFIKICESIRVGYFSEWDSGLSLYDRVKYSKRKQDENDRVQYHINNNMKLKRLVMNELFLEESKNTLSSLEKRIIDNSALRALFNHVKTAEHKRAVIRIMAVMLQMNKDLDFIEFLEDSYDETIKQYANEQTVIVSGGEWSVTRMKKRITLNLLKDLRKREQWVFDVPIINVPMDGLLGITDSKYKWALNRYSPKTEMGLYLLDMKASILDERVETELIRILFSAAFSYLEPMYNREHISSPIPSKFCIKAEEISQYLYGSKTGLTSKFDEIVEKMRYTRLNTEGMVQEKTGPVSLKVVDELEYNPYLNTITFTTPYISHVVTSMLKDGHDRAVRKMREREKKESAKAKKQNRDEVESKYYESDFPLKVTYLEKPSLVTQKDEDAKAIVREILSWVKSANIFDEVTVKHSDTTEVVENIVLADGTTEKDTDAWTDQRFETYYQVGTFKTGKSKGKQKKAEIYCSTLIDRVPTLKEKLETLQNRTVKLNDTFTHAWMYLYKYTRFKDDYPYLVFPGNNMKEIDKLDVKDEDEGKLFRKWVPTVKTMDDLKIVLEPPTREQQINNKK